MPGGKDAIPLFNRRSGRIDYEEVYGRRAMDLFYGTTWGRRITRRLLIRRPLSILYGRLQKHPVSRQQIAGFIDQYHIDMSQVVVPPGGFRSFNDFFIRRLKPEARPIDTAPDTLISPADSRLQAFTIETNRHLHIKGTAMTVPQLLGISRGLDDRFKGGLCLCFRLAPCDYHRFTYVDDGVQGPVHSVQGPLHSVSPLSLRHKPDIHCTNFRQWCLLQSRLFDTMIQIEVGAMMVGSVVQHQPDGGLCRRGGEKGYFQFGGSTVILIFEPGRVAMDEDIAAYSGTGIETLVQCGERVGIASH